MFSPLHSSINEEHHEKHDVDLCIPMYTSVYPCIPVYTHVYQCIPLYTHVYKCIPMYTSVYHCIPMYTVVYTSVQPVYARMCRSDWCSTTSQCVYTCIPCIHQSIQGHLVLHHAISPDYNSPLMLQAGFLAPGVLPPR